MSFCNKGCPRHPQSPGADNGCYYEPGCWKGYLDVVLRALRKLSRNGSKTETETTNQNIRPDMES